MKLQETKAKTTQTPSEHFLSVVFLIVIVGGLFGGMALAEGIHFSELTGRQIVDTLLGLLTSGMMLLFGLVGLGMLIWGSTENEWLKVGKGILYFVAGGTVYIWGSYIAYN
jgi:hypothetical protein